LDVAAVIKHLDLVITPDTSIVHIASAFNIPIVTIHEDNRDSHQLFAPTSKYSRTVFSEFSDRLDGYNVSKIIENSINLIAKNEG
jgi:ADP-heptose:LPS heptosyltransferase